MTAGKDCMAFRAVFDKISFPVWNDILRSVVRGPTL